MSAFSCIWPGKAGCGRGSKTSPQRPLKKGSRVGQSVHSGARMAIGPCMQRDLPREPGSHHAAPKPGPDQARGPQANTSAKPARPGGGAPPRGPETRGGGDRTQGQDKASKTKTQEAKQNKARRASQDSQEHQSQADQRPAKQGRTKRRQNKPKQNQASKTKTSQSKAGGWETAKVGASPRWFANARSRQKPAKPGERQLCRPDLSHTHEHLAPASPRTFACPFP